MARFSVVLVLALAGWLPRIAEATILNATSLQSIYIRGDAANAGVNQNGDTDVEDLTGRLTSTDDIRSLYQFSLAAIVNDVNTIGGGNFANLTINSVTLTLFERRFAQGNGFPANNQLPYDVRSYGFNFIETVTTWNDPDGDGNAGTGDTTAGGTLGSILTSATLVRADLVNDNDSYAFPDAIAFQVAVAAAAQGDASLELMVDSSHTTTQAFFSFASDETVNASRRPLLTVDYTITPVPEPSTWLLAVGACLGLAALRRRKRS
jgi:hypothetical protein